MGMKTGYSEKLQNPLWQRKRLEIFNRDNWTCQSCGCKTVQLEVHHVDYFEGKDPWEYDYDSLITVCRNCHEQEEVRFQHEKYLLKSLKFNGFMAVDILALSTLLSQDSKFTDLLKKRIREYSKEY